MVAECGYCLDQCADNNGHAMCLMGVVVVIAVAVIVVMYAFDCLFFVASYSEYIILSTQTVVL